MTFRVASPNTFGRVCLLNIEVNSQLLAICGSIWSVGGWVDGWIFNTYGDFLDTAGIETLTLSGMVNGGGKVGSWEGSLVDESGHKKTGKIAGSKH